MRNPRACTALVALLALLAVAPAASASTFTWTGGGDGHSWSDGENWDTRTVPTAAAATTAVINGVVTVTNPTGIIGEVQLKAGATLRGTTFTVNRLVMLCGRVGFDELTVLGGEVAGGIIEGTFVAAGSILQRRVTGSDCSPTDGGMNTPFTAIAAGGELIVSGSWRSSTGTYLFGLNCCGAITSSGMTVESTGSLIGDAPGGISAVNLMLRLRGRIQGAVAIDGSRATFESGAATAGGRGIRAGAHVRLVGGELTSIAGRLLIHDGGVLELVDAPNQLSGPGAIERVPAAGQPVATLRLSGGQLLRTITTGAGLRVQKSGPASTWVRTLGGEAAHLVVLGPSTLAGPGRVDVDALASVDLRGATTVTGSARVQGVSCCRASEIPTLRLAGTTTIGRGAALDVSSARLVLAGRTVGAGRLSLLGGLHALEAGAALGTAETSLEAGAAVALPVGSVTVDSAVEQVDADVTGPPRTGAGAGLATLAGQGSWAWRSGTVAGEVQLDLPLTASGAAIDRRLGGRLGVSRRTTLAGALGLDPGSVLRLAGDTSLIKLDARTSGTPRALVRVRPGATVRVSRLGLVGASLAGVGLEVAGELELDGASLGLGGGVATITSGTVRLQGGALSAAASFVQRDARVVGPGTVRGNLDVAGTVRLARRGVLDVDGAWRGRRTGRVELTRAGGAADRIDATGAVILDGTLALGGFVRPGARAVDLIRGATLSGRFDRAIGVPRRSSLRYAATALRLTRFS